MRLLTLLTLGIAALSPMCACQTTTVTTIWKTSTPLPTQSFKKVVALVVNATPAERRAAEDELVKQVRTAQGIPAYTLISDGDLKDREKMKAILKSNGIDGAVVLRLVASDKTITYISPAYIDRGYGLYDYRYDYGPVYREGHTETDIVIRAEISVYSVEDGQLLWAGASSTSNPADVRDLVVQVGKCAREELHKQGLLP